MGIDLLDQPNFPITDAVMVRYWVKIWDLVHGQNWGSAWWQGRSKSRRSNLTTSRGWRRGFRPIWITIRCRKKMTSRWLLRTRCIWWHGSSSRYVMDNLRGWSRWTWSGENCFCGQLTTRISIQIELRQTKDMQLTEGTWQLGLQPTFSSALSSMSADRYPSIIWRGAQICNMPVNGSRIWIFLHHGPKEEVRNQVAQYKEPHTNGKQNTGWLSGMAKLLQCWCQFFVCETVGGTLQRIQNMWHLVLRNFAKTQDDEWTVTVIGIKGPCWHCRSTSLGPHDVVCLTVVHDLSTQLCKDRGVLSSSECYTRREVPFGEAIYCLCQPLESQKRSAM